VTAELVRAVALGVLRGHLRRVEDVLVLLQLGRHVEDEAVGVRPLLVALLGVALVEKVAQLVAGGIVLGGQRVGAD
jgi:hypothetical protein